MARNLSETAAFTATVTVPENGDPVAAETRDPAFQALANRTTYLNGEVNTLDNRLQDVEGYIVDDEWTYPTPKTRVVVFSALGSPEIDGAGLPGWRLSTSIQQSRTNSASLGIPLRLPSGVAITRVRVLLKPGAARVGAARMNFYARIQTLDYDVPGSSNNDLGPYYDDGTNAVQVVTSGAISGTIAADQILWILAQAGDTGAAFPDDLYSVEVQFTDPGPRNF